MSNKMMRMDDNAHRKIMIKLAMQDMGRRLGSVGRHVRQTNEFMRLIFSDNWFVKMVTVSIIISPNMSKLGWPLWSQLIPLVFACLCLSLITRICNAAELEVKRIGSSYKQDLDLRAQAFLREAGSITLVDHKPEELDGVLTVLPTDYVGKIEMCSEDSVEEMKHMIESRVEGSSFAKLIPVNSPGRFRSLKAGDRIEFLTATGLPHYTTHAIVEDKEELLIMLRLSSTKRGIDLLERHHLKMIERCFDLEMRQFVKEVSIRLDDQNNPLPHCAITIGSSVGIRESDGEVLMGGGVDEVLLLKPSTIDGKPDNALLLEALMGHTRSLFKSMEEECHCDCHYSFDMDNGDYGSCGCCSPSQTHTKTAFDPDIVVKGSIGVRFVHENHVIYDEVYHVNVDINPFNHVYILVWNNTNLPKPGVYRRYRHKESIRVGDEVILRPPLPHDPQYQYGFKDMSRCNASSTVVRLAKHEIVCEQTSSTGELENISVDRWNLMKKIA